MATYLRGPADGFLHDSRYDLDDAVYPLGAAFFAALTDVRRRNSR
jgi:hypothetical protein